MKRTLITSLSLLIILSGSGCQKVKGIFAEPAQEGVTHKSYPVRVFGYHSSVVVNATPQEFTEYFRDFSPLEKSSRFIKMEFRDLGSDFDITEVGTLVKVDIRAMGLTIPCNFINLRYAPDEEVWMMIQFDGNWILMRFKLKPIGDRTIISLKALAQPSKNISAVLDTLNFLEVAARRLDIILAVFQAEFDPSLDVKELTKRGLRGEVYEAFFQADEASIWIDAGPEEVVENLLSNWESNLPEMRLKQECRLEEFINIPEGKLYRCPARVEISNLDIDLDAFFNWIEKKRNPVLGIYAPGSEDFVFINLKALQEAGGCLLSATVYNELPGAAHENTEDIMMVLSEIPGLMAGALVNIKKAVEVSG